MTSKLNVWYDTLCTRIYRKEWCVCCRPLLTCSAWAVMRIHTREGGSLLILCAYSQYRSPVRVASNSTRVTLVYEYPLMAYMIPPIHFISIYYIYFSLSTFFFKRVVVVQKNSFSLCPLIFFFSFLIKNETGGGSLLWRKSITSLPAHNVNVCVLLFFI